MNEHGVIDLASRRKIDPTQAVDLTPLLAKKKYDHLWTHTLQFVIPPEAMNLHMEQRERFAVFASEGGDLDVEQPEELIELPVLVDHLILKVGPGCSKCGIHADDPQNGWPNKCHVSDEDFFAKHTQVQAQADGIRGQAFAQLVQKKMAEKQ